MSGIRCQSMRITAALLMVTQLQACTSWQYQTLPVAPDQPEVVRIYRSSDSTYYEVYGPRVVGDSLIGLLGSPQSLALPVRLAIPISEITTIESKKMSPGRTAIFSVGMAFVILGAFAATHPSDFVVGFGEF